MKVMTLRRAGSCAECASPLEAGSRAGWDATTRAVHCLSCLQQDQQAPSGPPAAPPTTWGAQQPARTSPASVEGAAAGASAQREFERRVERRAQTVRQQHPKLGRLLLALTDDPASTRVWAQGAAGERAVAARLDELAGDHVVALHDRRMVRVDGRRSRANIDHLVVAAKGVWVVDAKTHTGTLEVRRSGGLLKPRVERLYIAGRDKSSLIEGLRGQVEAVAEVLAHVGANVPVRGALCFVGTELPWFGESIGGVPLVGRRGLAKLLKQPGDLGAEERTAVAAYLAAHFVPA